ncbi:MAG: hypothetical protein NTX53_03335, partial [candidate division WOR-3 bacterium]|nr:hypothetical protein [candidate division WOR-3 bacterium]
MERRKKQEPEHESPHETRIVRAVEAAGVSDDDRPFYLTFARELDVCLRHSRGPDFSPETKRLVMKWFGRGLSGHKLWLVCEALLHHPDSGTA